MVCISCKPVVSFVISCMLISIFFIGIIFYFPVVRADYTNPYYVIGTSILCGHNHWDPNHTIYAGSYDRNNSPTFHTDTYPGMNTNFSQWESNATATTGWDAYNLGWGGGNMEIYHMADTLNGTYGQGGLWRAPYDKEDVTILIMDHHHEYADGLNLTECQENCTAFYNWFTTYMPNCTLYTIGFTPDSSAAGRRPYCRGMAAWWDAFEEGKSNLVYVNITDFSVLELTNQSIWQSDNWHVNSSLYDDAIHFNNDGAEAVGDLIAEYILYGGPYSGGGYNAPVITSMGYSGSGDLLNQSVMVGTFYVNFSYDTNGTPSYFWLNISHYSAFNSTVKNVNITSGWEDGWCNESISTDVVASTDKYYVHVRGFYGG